MAEFFTGDRVVFTMDAKTFPGSDWDGVVPKGTTGTFVGLSLPGLSGVTKALIRPDSGLIEGLRPDGYVAVTLITFEKADE